MLEHFAYCSSGGFESLKLAMNSTTRASAAPTGDDDFQQKRREILAEAQSAPTNGETLPVQHRFKAGGSL